MSLHTWTIEDFHGEKTAVCRDAGGVIVSRWKWCRVGYLIRNNSGYGPGWVEPRYGTPSKVMELLGGHGRVAA